MRPCGVRQCGVRQCGVRQCGVRQCGVRQRGVRQCEVCTGVTGYTGDPLNTPQLEQQENSALRNSPPAKTVYL